MRISRSVSAVVLCLGLVLAAICFAEPKIDVWPIWEVHKANSTQAVDHKVWQAFVGKYLRRTHHGKPEIAYRVVTDSDRMALDDYVVSLSRIRIKSFNRNEQLAFWLNLYNALSVQLVLMHFPVTSINDINISSGMSKSGPWDANLAKVDKTWLSLNDIKYRILLPIWKDEWQSADINKALACQKLGCPGLSRQVFTGKNVSELLVKKDSAAAK